MERRVVLIAAWAIAASISPMVSFVGEASGDPACYIEAPDGQQTNLEQLCEPEPVDYLSPVDSPSAGVELDEQTLTYLDELGISESEYQEILRLSETNPDAAREEFLEHFCTDESSQGIKNCSFTNNGIINAI
ncbi:hypothetical protein D0962_37720 [Leptolyngbyaceae cyanobacterium CCMR0082]|uniref:UBA domain-containing protein n=1 Tax=Adonisia turfae CCMR0082 TaxID=2304604 RepID=A0A6M0SKR3_9CYAN|nr:hypothetical protein [Adonisia turfae]NEZ68393.1 hypothetical protein [Adonisia turfae CCMR0082]